MILFIDFWLRWALWLWTVGLHFGATLRLLTPAAVVLAEHRLWTPAFGNRRPRAQLLHGVWGLPGAGD